MVNERPSTIIDGRMRRRRGQTLLVIATLCSVVGCGQVFDGDSVADSWLIRDDADLFDAAQIERIEAYHAGLRDAHDVDYRVVTSSDILDIDKHANSTLRAIAPVSRHGRAALLVVDPSGDRVRLEVGGRLEHVLTDAFVSYVEREQMVPFFRSGRVADGIVATTELLVAQFQQHGVAAASGPQDSADGFAAGAGAGQKAFIGAGAVPNEDLPGLRSTPGLDQDPRLVVDGYLSEMARRNSNPDLQLYSQASREFLAQWTVTPAQMDNVVRIARGCEWEEARFDAAGAHAVIRAGRTARQCAPWFLVRERDAWRLDLATMSEVTRFGRANAWRFATTPMPYGFAFTDWEFDRNGYPLGAIDD